MARSARARGSRPATSSRRNRSSRDLTTGLDALFAAPEQNIVFRILGFLLRLRAEILMATALVTVYVWTEPVMGSDWTLIAMGSTTVVVFLVPASRRYLVARLWCVITRHRIRSCLTRSKVRTMTRNGRMPFLLWAHPSPIGEDVRVWIPAGLSVRDLDHIADELAAACWASEVRIQPSRSQAATCVIAVIRRDPLAASTTLTPVLVSDIADAAAAATGRDAVIVPLPRRETLTPAASSTGTQRPATASTGTGTESGKPGRADLTKKTKKDDPAPPTSGLGGIDVSDYI